MILNFFLLFILLILLAVILFFMFSILFPAMKAQSFQVDNLLFSDLELHYVIPELHEIEKTGRKAVVLCSPDKQFDRKRLYYQRGQTCSLIYQLYGSLNDCMFSCIGMGDCAHNCPQEAFVFKRGTAIVTDLCTGCGQCIDVCPKHLIKLVDEKETKCVLCTAEKENGSLCSDCVKEQNIPNITKKSFKIWKTCYRMLKRQS